jgi:hypothetical protein
MGLVFDYFIDFGGALDGGEGWVKKILDCFFNR